MASPLPAESTVRNGSTKPPSFDPRHSCTLFRLPRELRDRIYAYALVSRHPIVWPSPPQSRKTTKKPSSHHHHHPYHQPQQQQHAPPPSTPPVPQHPDPPRHHLSPALLRTSRAVYHEAGPVLYARNVFSFPHPSDANMFRVVAAPQHAARVARIQLAIRERDVHLWTAYLGSARPERSLQADYPALRALRVAFPSSFWGAAAHHHGHHHHQQHQHHHQQQLQQQQQQQGPGGAANGGGGGGAGVGGDLSESYYRWANDPRLRELCLSLEHKTEPGVVRIVAAHALSAAQVRELVQAYPGELAADEAGVARLRKPVRIFNSEVTLELIPRP